MSRPGWKRVSFRVIPHDRFFVIGPSGDVHYERPESDRTKWQTEVDEANGRGMGNGYSIEPRESMDDEIERQEKIG